MFYIGLIAACGLGICIGMVVGVMVWESRAEADYRQMLASCKRLTLQMGVEGLPRGWTGGRADVTKTVGRN